MPERLKCENCGYITSQKICKACVLLEGLNKGKPKLGIKKTKWLYMYVFLYIIIIIIDQQIEWCKR